MNYKKVLAGLLAAAIVSSNALNCNLLADVSAAETDTDVVISDEQEEADDDGVIYGDFNGDESVDDTDAVIFLKNLAYGMEYAEQYDLNSDGQVNPCDYAVLRNHLCGNVEFIPCEPADTGWAEQYAGQAMQFSAQDAETFPGDTYAQLSFVPAAEYAMSDVFCFTVKTDQESAMKIDSVFVSGSSCTAAYYALSDTEWFVIVMNLDDPEEWDIELMDITVSVTSTDVTGAAVNGTVSISDAGIGSIYGETDGGFPISTANVTFPAYDAGNDGPTELPDDSGEPDPLFADLNGDGKLEFDDRDVLLEYLAYNRPYRADYDMNSDKELDAADYALLIQHIMGEIYYLPISAADENWQLNYADYACTFGADLCTALPTWNYATSYLYPTNGQAMGDVAAFRVSIPEGTGLCLEEVYADGENCAASVYPLSNTEMYVIVFNPGNNAETEISLDKLHVTVSRGADIYTAANGTVRISDAYIGSLYGETAEITEASASYLFPSADEGTPYFGDLTNDGDVWDDDLESMLFEIGFSDMTDFSAQYDFNYNGKVDAADYALLANYVHGNVPYLPYKVENRVWEQAYANYDNALTGTDCTGEADNINALVEFKPLNGESMPVCDLLTFDVSVSEGSGFTIDDIFVDGLGLQVETIMTPENTMRVMIYIPEVPCGGNDIYTPEYYGILNGIEVQLSRTMGIFTAAEGDVLITNASISTISGQSVQLADAFAHVTFAASDSERQFGDLNQDGMVMLNDGDLLIDHIARGEVYDETYDMNADGAVDVTDYALLYNHFFGDVETLPSNGADADWAANYADFQCTYNADTCNAHETVRHAAAYFFPDTNGAMGDIMAFRASVPEDSNLFLDDVYVQGEDCSAIVYPVSDKELFVIVHNTDNAASCDMMIDRLCVIVGRSDGIDTAASGTLMITEAYIGSIYGETAAINDSRTEISFAAADEESAEFGDLNCDGTIDRHDAYTLSAYLADQNTEYDFQYDMNYDGAVNASDFAMLANYVGGTIPYLPYSWTDDTWDTMPVGSLMAVDMVADQEDVSAVLTFAPVESEVMHIGDVMSFDVEVTGESGLILHSVTAAGKNIAMDHNRISDNKWNVIIYNPEAWFNPNEMFIGDVYAALETLSVTVCSYENIAADAECEVKITNATIGNLFGQTHAVADVSGYVGFGQGTDSAVLGDVNGDASADAMDAACILTAAAAVGSGNASGLTAEQEANADVNASGAFDAADAAIILQYAAAVGSGYEGTLSDYLG